MSRRGVICHQTPGGHTGTEGLLPGAASNWQSRPRADVHDRLLAGDRFVQMLTPELDTLTQGVCRTLTPYPAASMTWPCCVALQVHDWAWASSAVDLLHA